MLKFNLANLNGRFRTVQEQEDGREENNINTIVSEPGNPEEATAQAQVRSKKRYSAYRTVVSRHEEFSARISSAEQEGAQRAPDDP